MQAFTQLTGLVVPLDRPNVDTDAIIPKQYLRSIKRSGFGPNLFESWRYLDQGGPGMDHRQRPLNTEFVLNQPRYADAQVLLARENFGCGSSREHAVWALDDYGIRAVIAPSFADIFFSNSFKNGLLPIRLSAQIVDQLFAEVAAQVGYALAIDLQNQTVTTPSGNTINFEVEAFRRYRLLNGLDDIDLTLQHKDAIKTFEAAYCQQQPWLFK